MCAGCNDTESDDRKPFQSGADRGKRHRIRGVFKKYRDKCFGGQYRRDNVLIYKRVCVRPCICEYSKRNPKSPVLSRFNYYARLNRVGPFRSGVKTMWFFCFFTPITVDVVQRGNKTQSPGTESKDFRKMARSRGPLHIVRTRVF